MNFAIGRLFTYLLIYSFIYLLIYVFTQFFILFSGTKENQRVNGRDWVYQQRRRTIPVGDFQLLRNWSGITNLGHLELWILALAISLLFIHPKLTLIHTYSFQKNLNPKYMHRLFIVPPFVRFAYEVVDIV